MVLSAAHRLRQRVCIVYGVWLYHSRQVSHTLRRLLMKHIQDAHLGLCLVHQGWEGSSPCMKKGLTICTDDSCLLFFFTCRLPTALPGGWSADCIFAGCPSLFRQLEVPISASGRLSSNITMSLQDGHQPASQPRLCHLEIARDSLVQSGT